jgi:hypothetical protein
MNLRPLVVASLISYRLVERIPAGIALVADASPTGDLQFPIFRLSQDRQEPGLRDPAQGEKRAQESTPLFVIVNNPLTTNLFPESV